MEAETMDTMQNGNATKIWIGIAVGAAVGIGIALSRAGRKKSRWDSVGQVTKRVADKSPDFAEATRDIMEHVRNIYEEGRKVADEAVELWSHGRKLVGY